MINSDAKYCPPGLSSLLENYPDARIIIDSSLNVISFNNVFDEKFNRLVSDNLKLNLAGLFKSFTNKSVCDLCDLANNAVIAGSATSDFLYKPNSDIEIPVRINALVIDKINVRLLLIISELESISGSDLLDISLKNYRESFNATNESVFICESETGNILDANSSSLELFEIFYLDIFNFNLPGLLASTEEEKEKVSKSLFQTENNGPQIFEMKCIKKNRTAFWIEVSLRSYQFNDIKRIIAVIKDITERKNAEYDLLNSENLWRSLIHNAPNNIFIMDPSGKILIKNISRAGIPAVNSPEIIYHFFDPQFHSQIKNNLCKVVDSGKKVTFELSFTNSETGKRWFEVNLAPVANRSVVEKLIMVLTDITERKETEEALKLSEDKFSKLFQLSPNIIMLVSIDEGIIFDVNDNGTRILGFQRDALIDKSIFNLGIFCKESYSKLTNELKLKGFFNNVELKIHNNCRSEIIGLFSGQFLSVSGKNLIFLTIVNITEFRNAELALKENEEKFRLITENTNDVIWTLDKNLKFKYVSPSVYKLRGYTPAEVLNQTLEEVLTPESLKVVTDAVKNTFRLMSEGVENLQSNIYEIAQPHKDGHIIWTETVVSVILDDNDNFKLFLGVTRDISDRKKAGEIIKENELKYKTLFETANDAIIIIKNQKIIDCNIKALELLKCKYSEIIEKSPMVFFADGKKYNRNSRKNLLLKLDKALKGEPQIFDSLNKKKDGTLFETEVSLNNIVVGDDNYLQAIIRDLSERKAFERNLIESENKFRDFAEKSMVGVYLLQGNIFKYANEKVCQFLGYTSDEVIEKLTLQDIVHPDDLSLVWNYVFERIDGKMDSINYQFRCLSKNGSVVFVEVYGSRTVYQGKPAIIGSLIDITEKRKADLEIIAAKEEAEKSNRLKSEFLAQMSHEIRTPVNTILSYASLIREELEEDMPVELSQSFSIMNRAGKRIIRTIDLILNLSQLQTGTFEYLPEKFDIFSRIIENLYLENNKIAKEKNLELYMEVDNKFDKYYIFADEYTVYQIFANLIDNAIKYTEKGHIKIFTGKDSDENVFVEITDTGIGISEEYIPHLFDAFTQEDQGYTRKFEGNGLGLALVREYCRLNKAVIKVTSIKNSGSTFRVTFV